MFGRVSPARFTLLGAARGNELRLVLAGLAACVAYTRNSSCGVPLTDWSPELVFVFVF